MRVKAGDTEHTTTTYDCLQGCGVQVQPSEAGSPAFSIAINKVLMDSRYTEAAQALSRKLRARKNTPVEEAAGTAVHLHHHKAIILHTCSFSPHQASTESARSASACDEHADSLSKKRWIVKRTSEGFMVGAKKVLPCRSHRARPGDRGRCLPEDTG